MEREKRPEGSNKPKAKWDTAKGRYTESGDGVYDERQTARLDQKLDPGSYTGKPKDGSLTNDEK